MDGPMKYVKNGVVNYDRIDFALKERGPRASLLIWLLRQELAEIHDLVIARTGYDPSRNVFSIGLLGGAFTQMLMTATRLSEAALPMRATIRAVIDDQSSSAHHHAEEMAEALLDEWDDESGGKIFNYTDPATEEE